MILTVQRKLIRFPWKLIDSPVGIKLLKVNNRNIRTRCEVPPKLTVKIP